MRDKTDAMGEPAPDTAILIRTFELDGQHIVHAYIWPPLEDSDGLSFNCRYQITGLGDERLCPAYGVDALQALEIALQFISLKLYNSPEYAADRLTFYGKRDLLLPELPGLRFGEYGHGKAAVIHQSGEFSVVRMPKERFPRIALTAESFNDAVEVSGKKGTKRLLKALRSIRSRYEKICNRAGFALPYVKRRK